MAGVGFALRNLMRKDTLLGRIQAYGVAGTISCGPWVLSIAAILAIGMIGERNGTRDDFVTQFQLSVTYLMAFSLVLTGPLQLMFSRFTADRLFEERHDVVLPNLFGALTVTLLAAGLVATPVLTLCFDASFSYRFGMLASFAALCGLWVLITFAAAIQEYRWILLAFALGYGITVGGALMLRRHGLEGLMLSFAIGQVVLFFCLLALVIREYPGKGFIAFDFLRRAQIFPSLAVTGLLYNLGIWVDKLIFWINADTGVTVIAPLRASPIYDLPIFLAYLSIIPGMALFLMRCETEFAERCQSLFRTITSGGTLAQISEEKDRLVESARGMLFDIVKVQGVTTLVLIAGGEQLLSWFGISPMYQVLLNIDLVAVAVQVVLLAVFNVFFYLDQRVMVLRLSLLFVACNVLLTLLTIYLGPTTYGYGFAGAVLVTTVVALAALSRKLDRLEYETFMLQPASC